MSRDYTCPGCGKGRFQVSVETVSEINFREDGEHDVINEGSDLNFDDDSQAVCCNLKCGWSGPLSDCKVPLTWASISCPATVAHGILILESGVEISLKGVELALRAATGEIPSEFASYTDARTALNILTEELK